MNILLQQFLLELYSLEQRKKLHWFCGIVTATIRKTLACIEDEENEHIYSLLQGSIVWDNHNKAIIYQATN